VSERLPFCPRCLRKRRIVLYPIVPAADGLYLTGSAYKRGADGLVYAYEGDDQQPCRCAAPKEGDHE